MITLARLLNGARGDRWRLAAIAGGVALGVALALSLWSGFTAITDRNLRSTWIDESRSWQDRIELDDQTALAPEQLLVFTDHDRFGDREITVLRVATTPDTTTTLPGIGRPPAPGTSAVSPALAGLIASHPADELGARFGTVVAELPDTVLAGPNALAAVIGAEPAELANDGTVFHSLSGSDFATENYRSVAVIGAIAVGFPVVILLSVVTSLGSAKREEQLATLRLLGATPGTLARLAAWETAATSLTGAVTGIALAWLVAPALAGIELGGVRFFPDELRPRPDAAMAIPARVVAIAVGIAALRARRLRTGPLGGSREQAETSPRWRRLVPLTLGLIGLLVAHWVPAPAMNGLLVIGSFALVTVGLVVAGPPLLAGLARFGAQRAPGPVGVMALNRIRRHPRQSFRAVSGLVIACFVVSVFAGGRTTLDTVHLPEGPDYLPPQTLIAQLSRTPAPPPLDDPALLADLAALRAVPGVTAVATAFENGDSTAYLTGTGATALGYPSTAPLVGVDEDYVSAPFQPHAVPPLPYPPRATTLFVQTADATALERVRTALLSGQVGLRPYGSLLTRAEWSRAGTRNAEADEYGTLASLGILVAAGISALALATATLAGVLDRRRVFGLLRLTGLSPRTLGGIIAAEAAVPLLAVFVAVAALGQFVAWAMVTGLTEGRRTTGWPGADFYLVLAACLGMAAAAIVASVAAARHNTTAVTRFE